MAVFPPAVQPFNKMQESPSAQICAQNHSTMTELLDPNVIITDRLLLRPLLPTDGVAIYALRSNPEIIATCLTHLQVETKAEFVGFLKSYAESKKCVSHCVELLVSSQHEIKKMEDQEQRITRNEKDEPDSVYEVQGDSEVIGLVGAHQVPEIGYMFLPEHWGKGYATEAMRAWMGWYWKVYPGNDKEGEYLKAVTGPEAVSSRRVLQKCGFTWWCKSQREVERHDEDKEVNVGNIVVDVWKAERPCLRRNSLDSGQPARFP